MSREDEVRKLQAENQQMAGTSNHGSSPTFIIGIVIVVVGIAFLSMILTKSAGADLLPKQTVPFLVFLGGIMLTSTGKAGAGLGLMALALLFLLRNFGIVPTETFDAAWFAFLALGGLLIALMSQAGKRAK